MYQIEICPQCYQVLADEGRNSPCVAAARLGVYDALDFRHPRLLMVRRSYYQVSSKTLPCPSSCAARPEGAFSLSNAAPSIGFGELYNGFQGGGSKNSSYHSFVKWSMIGGFFVRDWGRC